MSTIRPSIILDRYSVVAHQAEEGGYWGEVVELPGCVSQGETEVELMHNIREAIEAVLVAARENPPVVFYVVSKVQDADTIKVYANSPSTWTAGH